MKFRIEIDCDNAAFGDGELMYEVADVLTTIAGRISRFECGVDHPMAIFDRNGNRIGTADFLIDPEGLPALKLGRRRLFDGQAVIKSRERG